MNAQSCTDYGALKQLYLQYPQVEVRYTIPIGGRAYGPDTETVILQQLTREDIALMEQLPRLTQVDGTGCRESALLQELEECLARLEWLMARINLTNSTVKVGGKTLTELIARRDVLSLRAEAYRCLVGEASQNTRRATRTEIKILSAVEVPALQKTADEAARQLRLLDNTLQATNWTADLLE